MKFSKLSFVVPALLIFLFSCTMEKRVHRDGYSMQWIKSKKNSHNRTASYEPLSNDTAIVLNNQVEYNLTASTQLDVSDFQRTRMNKKAVLSILENKSEPCDIMTLKTGSDMLVKVVEIGINDIKYKDCDNLDGPVVVIRKADVFRIKYLNGKVETFTNNNEASQSESNQQKGATTNPTTTVNAMAIIGLVAGILAILVAFVPILGWFFGILGILFALIAFIAIKNNPEKFRGKGLAIAAAVTGAVGFLLGIFWFLFNLWVLGII